MATVLGFAAAIPPARWVDSFFLAAAGGILVLQLFPRDLRRHIGEYGARRSPSAAEAGSVDRRRSGPGPRPPARTVQNCLAALAGAPVPHAYFWHYYLLSVSWSALWAWQFLCSGSLMAAMARAQVVAQADSVDLACVVLAWAMLLAQGLRRLYESLCVSRPGRTPMLVIHWLLGLAYYSVMNTAVWIHGAGALLGSPPPSVLAAGRTLRLSSALALFFAASLTQNECHRYLASLEKYTLPTEGLFRYLVCPHYACECAIYLALAVVAAPAGSVVNSSVLCGLVFVTVNLGVTAHGTKKWYGRKFGQDKVAGRWSMIPLVI